MYKVILSVLVLMSVGLVGCGGPQVRRTLETDHMLRVLIDPRIDASNYVQIRRALVQSGKFEVVDRRDGFEALIREQDLQFRSSYSDRFSDREKWAHIGKAYGAAGIITAHADCYQDKSFWGEYRKYCKQNLSFINGSTGVVEFAVSGLNSEPWVASHTVPDWDAVVAKAVDTYPEYFKPRVVKYPLNQYMDQSEELSKRERVRARMPAAQRAAVSE